MVVPCQACGAANDDEARFCDQCGAVLDGALVSDRSAAAIVPPAAPTDTPQHRPVALKDGSGANWIGIGVIALILAGLSSLFFGGNGGQTPPASSTAGGAEQTMMQAQADLEENKKKLAADPLDMGAITGMYNLYRQIGESEKVRPYIEAALAEVRKRHDTGTLGHEAAKKSTLDMAMAAMTGDDPMASVMAMEYYYELSPERPSTAVMIANIHYDIGLPAAALEWYDIYLAAADPALEGDTYLGAQVDRETMRMTLAKEDNQPELLDKAISELGAIAEARPDFWPARFNLGQAHLQHGDKHKALAAWEGALKLATTAEEKWRTEAAIAEAEDKPPPPMPAEMGTGSMDALDPSQNPHAGTGMPPTTGGGPDPHAGAGAGVDPHAGLGL